MSAVRIDEDSFYKLFSLVTSKKWVNKRSRQLTELFHSCDSLEQQNIVIHLIDNFRFVTSEDVEELGNSIAEKIEYGWNLKPENTVLMAISEDADVDGSQAYLQFLKNKFSRFEWAPNNFINSVGKGYKMLENDWNAILFDDFIGSGETMLRKYNWMLKKMANLSKQNVKVYVLTYAIMQDSYQKFLDNNIEIYSPMILRKGISDYFNEDDVKDYISEMCLLENKLEPYANNIHLSGYSLGYNRSETIFCFEGNNVPDNVFPIFWWPKLVPNKTRNTFFKRL